MLRKARLRDGGSRLGSPQSGEQGGGVWLLSLVAYGCIMEAHNRLARQTDGCIERFDAAPLVALALYVRESCAKSWRAARGIG